MNNDDHVLLGAEILRLVLRQQMTNQLVSCVCHDDDAKDRVTGCTLAGELTVAVV